MTTVLGICDGHDSGAAISVDGKIVAAISEERLTRQKRQPGFPFLSIQNCLELSDVKLDEIDKVVVSEQTGRAFFRLLNGLYSRTNPNQPLTRGANLFFMGAQNFISHTPFLAKIDRSLSQFILKRRLAKIGVTAPLTLIDHHLAHAISAAKCSGFDSGLTITTDAFGDGICATVYDYRQGELKLLSGTKFPHSPALLYGLVTALVGFNEGDEGKVFGLAATGSSEKTAPIFQKLFEYENGEVRARKYPYLTDLKKNLAGFSKPDIAAGLQHCVEELTANSISYWQSKTGHKNICLAGGLFANVRLNQAIIDRCNPDGFFVFPHMGDGGLCVGAALGVEKLTGPAQPFAPFTGPGQGRADSLPKNAQSFALDTKRIKQAARIIYDGGFVAVASGKMEFGPRALGARSILFSPRDPKTADRLSEKLHRPKIMPFAPVVRDCDFDNVAKGRAHLAFDYMTTTAQANPGIADKFPTAVHADGSMRVQVCKVKQTPAVYDILTAYSKLCAPALLINTSLNLHTEPIVADCKRAVEIFDELKFDALITGDRFITWKTGNN